MAIGWDNPMLTLKELAEKAGVTWNWLHGILLSDSDPFPTHKRSKQVKVLWSDYVDWSYRRYGDDGPLRGTEYLDLDFAKKRAKPKKTDN